MSAALTAAIIAILAVLAPLAAPAVAWAADTPPAPKEYSSRKGVQCHDFCSISFAGIVGTRVLVAAFNDDGAQVTVGRYDMQIGDGPDMDSLGARTSAGTTVGGVKDGLELTGRELAVPSYTENPERIYAADEHTRSMYYWDIDNFATGTSGAQELPNLKVPDGFTLAGVQEFGNKLAVIAAASDVYDVQIYDISSHRVTDSGEFRQFTPLYVAPDLKTVWGASDDDSNGSGHIIRARSISGGSVVDKPTDLDVQPYWTFDNGSTVLYDEKMGHYYRIDVGKDGKNVDDPTPLSDHAYQVLSMSSDRTIYTFIEDPKSSSDTNDLPNDPSGLKVVTKNFQTGKVLWSMKATNAILNTVVTGDDTPTGALTSDGRYLYAYAQASGTQAGRSKSIAVFDTRTGASADADIPYTDGITPAAPGGPIVLSPGDQDAIAQYRDESGLTAMAVYSTGYEPETEEHWGQGGLPIPVVIGIGVACALIIVMLTVRSITRARKRRFDEAVAQAVEKASAESSAESEFESLLSKSKKLPRMHVGAAVSHDSETPHGASAASGSVAAAVSGATRTSGPATWNVALPPLPPQSAPAVPKPVMPGATVPSAASQTAAGQAASTRFCAQCGARLGDDATRFCPNCGARL